jgi:hypothetical protein
MLTLRARQACLNFRCTPSGTLRMRMLPMLSKVPRIGGLRQVVPGRAAALLSNSRAAPLPVA